MSEFEFDLAPQAKDFMLFAYFGIVTKNITIGKQKVKQDTEYSAAKKCAYRVGEMVYPDSFNDNRWEECSNGIHFFMTEEEAKNYFI